MTVIKSEFFLALNQVATERGIPLEDVLSSIKAAVLAAYKKDFLAESQKDEEIEGLEVHIDPETGEMHIKQDGKDITPPGFGRIAAQTARQVVLQKIREAEKREIAKHYTDRVGSLIKGRVIRFDGRNVYFDIGKAEGCMPSEERIRTEDYRMNTPFTLYVKEISEDQYANSHIIVSRSDPRLVEELFRKEVPEIANEAVKIKGVVREPGERTKIAVYSEQSGVDPVGACVGQKGIRVKAVNDELGADEKIDIIQFNDDETLFIREALSPAKVTAIELDKKEKRAIVRVDEDQAPLAIGKGGVNVNLAARLTGYTLDIAQISPESEPEKAKAKAKKSSKKSEEPSEESVA